MRCNIHSGSHRHVTTYSLWNETRLVGWLMFSSDWSGLTGSGQISHDHRMMEAG